MTSTEIEPSERRALQALACPICDGGRFRELVRKKFQAGERLMKCEECGVVRLVGDVPFVTDYWAEDATSVDVYGDPAVQTELRPRYGRYLDRLAELCGGTGAILDGGCGIGNFLVAARDRGWSTAGIELSERAAQIARVRGLNVETASLERSGQPAEAFDAVTLWDLIEHLETPLAVLVRMREKLKPGGTMLLETPDEGFWLRRLLRTSFAITRGRADLLAYLYYPDHRFYYSAPTLCRLLQRAGLRPVRIWRDVTPTAKAQRKLAPWSFPLSRLVVPLLPSALGLANRLGIGNKLVVAAERI